MNLSEWYVNHKKLGIRSTSLHVLIGSFCEESKVEYQFSVHQILIYSFCSWDGSLARSQLKNELQILLYLDAFG